MRSRFCVQEYLAPPCALTDRNGALQRNLCNGTKGQGRPFQFLRVRVLLFPPLPPLSTLALSKFSSDGSVFPAEPCSEEREGGANQTAVGGPQESYIDAVGSLPLRVSCILCGAKRG